MAYFSLSLPWRLSTSPATHPAQDVGVATSPTSSPSSSQTSTPSSRASRELDGASVFDALEVLDEAKTQFRADCVDVDLVEQALAANWHCSAIVGDKFVFQKHRPKPMRLQTSFVQPKAPPPRRAATAPPPLVTLSPADDIFLCLDGDAQSDGDAAQQLVHLQFGQDLNRPVL